MAYADPEEGKAYYRAYGARNKEKMAARGRAWWLANRERKNGLDYLRRLRLMKDPLPRHVRKMAQLAAKFPKRRVVYSMD